MRFFLLVLLPLIPLSLLAAGPFCIQSKPSQESLNSLTEELNCQEMKTGERRIVNKSFFTSPTRMYAQYVIQKKSEKEYVIDLPLYIVDDNLRTSGKAIGMSSTKSEKEMEEKIRLCSAISDSLLKGPHGESLKLNPILSKKERKPWHRDMDESVTVVDQDSISFRTNSGNFPKDIDCRIVIHELLHHLGLVDEYVEGASSSSSLSGFDKDCRAHGPDDSIMSDQDIAFHRVLEFHDKNAPRRYQINATLCESRGQIDSCSEKEITEPVQLKPNEEMTSEKAKEVLENVYGPELPLKKARSVPPPTTTLRIGSLPPPEKVTYSAIRFKEAPKKLLPNSLLEPAHFRAIVYPGCKSKNALYYKCALFSRSTSHKEVKALGLKISNESPCNLPPECQTTDWLR